MFRFVILLILLLNSVKSHQQQDGSLRRQENDHGIVSSESNIDEQSIQLSKQQQQRDRQLFSFWNILFLINGNDHCPPGPLGHHCREGDSSTNSQSDESSSSAESYSAVTANTNANTASGSMTGEGITSKFSWFMLIAAAAASAVAVAAIIKGQRKQEIPPHPLKGSVARRKGIFQSFTDCALCDSVPSSNDRHLEMTMSKDDYDRCSV